MPPKFKRSSKKADRAGDCSPWLEKFCSKHGIRAALVEVFAEHQVISETILAGITEQDLSDMRLVVGHKIILRRVIATLNKPSDSSTNMAPSLTGSTSPEVSLQPFKLGDKLAKIEAEFDESKTAPPATPSQLPFAQFMLANFKILESLMTKKPAEASDYLKYLKFLVIKGTRFQTKAILAFDQDYRATKMDDNFSWGTNVDDLSARYFDAAVTLRPALSLSSRTYSTDGRKSTNQQPVTDEF
ncbi:hypothetical protein OS493_000623 [Desmophyllum pertusum]|uniref:SAM domain-containing protein n=1 Tax=Desmophyllum pertusum TaxID=174260 RepID=A0A9X0A8L8_9CNID|nr:hypothetical protein OS493_000623 [Desmophyllum pertusum]